MNTRVVMGSVLVCAAAFTASFGLCQRSLTAQFLSRAQRMQATVSRNVEKPTGMCGRTAFCPVLNIPTKDGRIVEIVHPAGQCRPRFAANQKINIYVDPVNPVDYRIDTFFDLWLFSTVYLVLSPVIALAGLITLWRGTRKKNETASQGQTPPA